MLHVVDPVRLFCLNCSPSVDLRGRRPTSVPASEYRIAQTALTYGELISLRTYRNTLQVFDLIVSGQGEHLYRPMLEFYGPREEPYEYMRLVAKFLVTSEPPLLEESIEEVARHVKASVDRWKARALDAALRTKE